MEKFRIYLAGYTLEKEYRRIVHEKYGSDFDIVDSVLDVPENYPKLPSVDKFLISTCQILVAYIRECSWGTAMEIIFAYDHNKLVFIIDPAEQIRKDYWVKFHCHKFFSSIDDCFLTLKTRNFYLLLGGENG
jgi:hypothetical protein